MKRTLLAVTDRSGAIIKCLSEVFAVLMLLLFSCATWAKTTVSVMPAKQARWQAHVQVLGEVRSLAHVVIRAPITGRLGPFQLSEGNHVETGRVIGRIVPPELAAQISAARSRLHLAHHLLNHELELHKQRLATLGALQKAIARVAITDDDLRALELKRKQAQLIAPTSGTIHFLVPARAEIVAGTPVARVSGTGRVWVRTFVPPSVARQLHSGETVTIRGDGRHWRGNIASLGDSARHDGLIEVFLHPFGRGLIPGEWLWINLPGSSGYGWQIPRKAVVMYGSHARIYVVRHHRAEAIPVEIANVGNQAVWLRGPLHPGEAIIIHGVSQVTNGCPVATHAIGSISTR